MGKKLLNESQLLESKTPAEFIDNSLHVNITSGRKAFVCKQWLIKTGYKIEDVQYARNRHPYWKKVKHKGHRERTIKRMSKYRFENVKVKWTLEEMQRFIELNETLHDFELAQIFRRSIPSIQFIRRKLRMLKTLMGTKFDKSSKKAELLLKWDEDMLRKKLKEGKEKNPDK